MWTGAESWRRRIWNIEVFYRCPVVGMCLTIGEQRQIFRKFDSGEKKRSDFFMHEMLVANIGTENPLSRKVDAVLARKFGPEARRLARMGEEEFMDRWRSGVGSGVNASELWAAVVHPELSHAARVEVFGSLHMAMHEQVGAFRAHTDQLEDFAGKVRRMRVALKATRGERDELLREKRRLDCAVKALREECEAYRRRVVYLEREHCLAEAGEGADSWAENVRLREDLDRRDEELLALRGQLQELEREHEDVMQELVQQVCTESGPDRRNPCTSRRCGPECPVFDLCRKRVLIVGGMNRMECVYRQFVEKCGGTLEYHDGRLRGGVKGLENSFKRADVVLCPVNCNSHGACLLVKNLGKKHKKPVHLLPGYGLSSMTRVMGEISTN